MITHSSLFEEFDENETFWIMLLYQTSFREIEFFLRWDWELNQLIKKMKQLNGREDWVREKDWRMMKRSFEGCQFAAGCAANFESILGQV